MNTTGSRSLDLTIGPSASVHQAIAIVTVMLRPDAIRDWWLTDRRTK